MGKNMFVGKTGWRVGNEGEGIVRSRGSGRQGVRSPGAQTL